jgi:hypothetical protein
MPRAFRPVFERLGVELVDSLEVRPNQPFGVVAGWQNKPFALVHSKFEEVLFLDADNFCLRNPEFLFDEPRYQASGCAFWPDFEGKAGDVACIKPFAWEFLELPPQPVGIELESGHPCRSFSI